jgi:hypothetical protein
MVTIIDPALKDGAEDNFVVHIHELIRLNNYNRSIILEFDHLFIPIPKPGKNKKSRPANCRTA